MFTFQYYYKLLINIKQRTYLLNKYKQLIALLIIYNNKITEALKFNKNCL